MAGFILPRLFTSGYRIKHSADFVHVSAPSLDYAVPSGANNKTWSLLGWFMFGRSGENGILGGTGGNSFNAAKNSSNNIVMSVAGVNTWTFGTAIVPLAWYWMAFVMDLYNATPSERMRLYIGDAQESASVSGSVSSGDSPGFNRYGDTSYLGYSPMYAGDLGYHDGLMAQTVLLDGVAITDPVADGWLKAGVKPIDVSGNTFPNISSFYLPFENSGALGTDESGLGNDLTVSGTINQSTDVPA